jgi:Zn-finger nucleic acid-binding protein
MSSMTCPKCHGSMRTYERSNVHVDQCTECRGIFLDRGELEHLIDGEQRWAAGAPAVAPAPASPQSPPQAPPPPQYQQQPPPYQQPYPPQHQQPYGKPAKKKRSFLEDLFD